VFVGGEVKESGMRRPETGKIVIIVLFILNA
jgi:hypothetical protein